MVEELSKGATLHSMRGLVGLSLLLKMRRRNRLERCGGLWQTVHLSLNGRGAVARRLRTAAPRQRSHRAASTEDREEYGERANTGWEEP